jgi:hypothetical protein
MRRDGKMYGVIVGGILWSEPRDCIAGSEALASEPPSSPSIWESRLARQIEGLGGLWITFGTDPSYRLDPSQ